MAAPNLQTLLDFETRFETAAETFLATATGLTTGTVYRTLEQDEFVCPRLEVMFEVGQAFDPPDERSTSDATLTYRKYEGTLTVKVVSEGTIAESYTGHRTYRAEVREALLISGSNFNATTLPYYDVQYMRPTGTVYDAEGNEQVSTLTYEIRFAIRNDAWPAS